MPDHMPTVAPRTLRALLIASLFCLGTALGIIGLLFWWGDQVTDNSDTSGPACCWHKPTTPEWLSGEIGVRVPEGATDLRAGYRVGERWDKGILAFTLPGAEAGAYLKRLVPDHLTMVANIAPPEKYGPSDTFEKLGLPDPETLKTGVQRIGLCPDGEGKTVEGKHLRTCADFFSHAYAPGKTRIYVRAHFEPGVSPLPK
ncbi:hypothetical protein ABZ714_22765 [Streptomyces sp. NPDC006798]|uniref:hypothetical protein n=1 Tax=Streptomyces sp. NPDC006798 TaxID=3155462 RepID=UPI0033F85CB2